MSCIPEKHFQDGKLVVLCTDHRYNTIVCEKLVLQPSHLATSQDISSFGMFVVLMKGVDFLGHEWNDQLAVEVEAQVLPIMVPHLDLGKILALMPSIGIGSDVLPRKLLENYNKTKYLLGRKRLLDGSVKEKEETKRKEDLKLMLLMDKVPMQLRPGKRC